MDQLTIQRFRQLRNIFWFVLLLLVLAELISMTGIVKAPHLMLGNFAVKGWSFLSFALMGTFFIHLLSRPKRNEIFVTIILGFLLEGMLISTRGGLSIPFSEVLNTRGDGFGIASLVILFVQSLRKNDEERTMLLTTLLAGFILPLYVVSINFYLLLTTAIHPRTYDLLLYAFDDTLGVQLSYVLGRILKSLDIFEPIVLFFYQGLPLVISIMFAVQLRKKARPQVNILSVFFLTGVIGYVLYNFYPAAGPIYWPDHGFPKSIPPISTLSVAPIILTGAVRNAMPSLHTAWALLLWWNSRGYTPWVRGAAGLYLGVILFSTLALGEHYLIDLIVAVPFAVAIQAICTTSVPLSHVERRTAILVGGGLTTLWFILLYIAIPLFQATPIISWLGILATVGISLLLEKRLARTSLAQGEEVIEEQETQADKLSRKNTVGVAIVFFLSGFAGLVYEVVFQKVLALTFGSTGTASNTVLATYMGGMALGAWLGGRLAAKRPDPLRVYAICEIGIAICCAVSPFLFFAVRHIYVWLAAGIDPASPILVAFQVVLGASVLLPPTILMGMTLPIFAKQFDTSTSSLGRTIGLLYGVNTIGAAVGALVAGYFILPLIGVTKAIWFAVMASLGAAFVSLVLQNAFGVLPTVSQEKRHEVPTSDGETIDKRLGRIAVIILTVGGVLTLALEVSYIHLLAVVAGNSTYAFSLMLFAFLLGLGGGAAVGRAWLKQKPSLPFALSLVELALAISILSGVYIWNTIPHYFASFATYPMTRSFGARELIRGLVCCLAMLPPALLIGVVYSLAMECVGRAYPLQKIRALGRTASLNTLGNIFGALIGGFILLPIAGSLMSVQVLAALALILGVLPVMFLTARQRWAVSIPILAVLMLFTFQPKTLDYTTLSTGANVYFASQSWGTVIDHAESLDGGLTTVAESRNPDGQRVLTLLTNGKFQGDDNVKREMKAQYSFALCPLLHTSKRDRALVIGFGTGTTARAIHESGFAQTDVVDLSKDILNLAQKHFSSVNNNVLRQPNVHTYVTDGRNFLLLQQHTYDVVSIEVSSIWFAGAASLYNREFYQLVKQRLNEGGVLQQWVQLHRLSALDILTVIGTIRAEFTNVWVYFGGSQGVIVASNADAQPSYETLNRLNQEVNLKEGLALFGGSATEILKSRIMTPADVNRYLEFSRIPLNELVSTDDNLRLEYSTPKGNVRDYQESLTLNLVFLQLFRSKLALEGTRLTEEDLVRLNKAVKKTADTR